MFHVLFSSSLPRVRASCVPDHPLLSVFQSLSFAKLSFTGPWTPAIKKHDSRTQPPLKSFFFIKKKEEEEEEEEKSTFDQSVKTAYSAQQQISAVLHICRSKKS